MMRLMLACFFVNSQKQKKKAKCGNEKKNRKDAEDALFFS